jgi:hypothetical protein
VTNMRDLVELLERVREELRKLEQQEIEQLLPLRLDVDRVIEAVRQDAR